MFPSKQRQRGAILIVIVAILILLAVSMLIGKTGEIVAAKGARVSATFEIESAIQKALISFTSTYQRLPCPADPTGATNPGWPNRNTNIAVAAGACTDQAGVVPWNALGLTQSQVTDEWGRLISYRVYDDTISQSQSTLNVGLTQSAGASAIFCANNYIPASSVPPDINGLCDQTNMPAQRTFNDAAAPNFITYAAIYDKGLKVTDFGNTINNVAFILISHGPSGQGGYLPSGTRIAPVAGTLDYVNTQPAVPPGFPMITFNKQTPSDIGIAVGAANFYDDIVSYLTIADLLRYSQQDSRAW
jgi:Tfp pilus assembly protein PilX